MGLFNTKNADTVRGVDEDLTKIATANFRVRGSVHDDGNVEITVKNQYGDLNHQPITVEASVHQGGTINIDVQNEHEWDDSLPEPSDVRGDSSVVGEKLEKRDVHNSGTLRFEIDDLVTVPLQDSRDRGPYLYDATGDRDYFKVLADEGYDCWDNVEVTGSVHSYGRVEIDIENLYVYKPENYKTVGDLI